MTTIALVAGATWVETGKDATSGLVVQKEPEVKRFIRRNEWGRLNEFLPLCMGGAKA